MILLSSSFSVVSQSAFHSNIKYLTKKVKIKLQINVHGLLISLLLLFLFFFFLFSDSSIRAPPVHSVRV